MKRPGINSRSRSVYSVALVPTRFHGTRVAVAAPPPNTQADPPCCRKVASVLGAPRPGSPLMNRSDTMPVLALAGELVYVADELSRYQIPYLYLPTTASGTMQVELRRVDSVANAYAWKAAGKQGQGPPFPGSADAPFHG